MEEKTIGQKLLGENKYLPDGTVVTVEKLRGWLRAYEKSGSMGVASSATGISSSEVRRRMLVDGEFAEAFGVAKKVVGDMVEAKLLEGAMSGVLEEEWEDDGVKYKRRHDFRYLDRVLREQMPEKYGERANAPDPSGGTVLQVNITGFGGMEMKVVAPETVVADKGLGL